MGVTGVPSSNPSRSLAISARTAGGTLLLVFPGAIVEGFIGSSSDGRGGGHRAEAGECGVIRKNIGKSEGGGGKLKNSRNLGWCSLSQIENCELNMRSSKSAGILSYVVCHISVVCCMSYVICCMSYVVCRMSCVVCHMSYVICCVSYVVCRMSCVVCHMSYVICRVSCVVCRMSCVVSCMSYIVCRVSYIICHVL